MKKPSKHQKSDTSRDTSGKNAQAHSQAKVHTDYEILPAEDLRDPRRQSGPQSGGASKTSSSKGLVSYNPLVAYLREIRQIPRMTKPEEIALARKYAEDQDLKIAYQLISANLWLVVKIARKYENMAKNVLDLIQEGNIGLMEAVRKFDPEQDVRLPTYASWWIKAYIVRYVLANWRLVKIGTTQAQKKLFFNLSKEKKRLESQGYYPTAKLLAQNLDVKESEVVEMEQRLRLPDLSFDAPVSSGAEESGREDFHAVIADQAVSVETEMIEDQISTQISQAFGEFNQLLSPKQQEIFAARMTAEKKSTLKELAEKFNISMEAIRQNEQTIEKKLKKFISEHYPLLKNSEQS